ncbi:MAG: winged helix-turn-helix transcriptional regulator [Nanoarchaeota archaeon]
MRNIKEAFQKVKKDIDFVNNEINFLKKEAIQNKENISNISKSLKRIEEFLENIKNNKSLNNSTDYIKNNLISTDKQTNRQLFKPLETQYLPFSTGNKGASTDKQTNRQTDKQTQKNQNSIENAVKILDSLDNIKKEIRIKFKNITEQEFLIFLTLYQIDEQSGPSNYKVLSQKLNLSESSIRDYIRRLIKKGIPIQKEKINNKIIQLSISNNLKKVVSLSTILQLRHL